MTKLAYLSYFYPRATFLSLQMVFSLTRAVVCTILEDSSCFGPLFTKTATRYWNMCTSFLSVSMPMPFMLHVYKNIAMTKLAHQSYFYLSATFLFLQMVFSLERAVAVSAIMEVISALDVRKDCKRYQKMCNGFLSVSMPTPFGVICHHLGLLCTDIHVVGCRGPI